MGGVIYISGLGWAGCWLFCCLWRVGRNRLVDTRGFGMFVSGGLGAASWSVRRWLWMVLVWFGF